jgi:hypothetical protein
MREFAITEISAVDHPAQKGALMAIIKSDAYAKVKKTAQVRAEWRKVNPGKSLADMPPALHKLGVGDFFAKFYADPTMGAMTFDEVIQHCMDEDKYYEVMREVGSSISALEQSLRSIAADQAIDSAQKQNMIRDSVESFMAAIRTRWPDVEEALASAPENMSGSMAGQVVPATKGVSDMDARELEAQVATLTKQLELATKASKDGKLAIDLQKSVDEANAKLAKATEELAEATAKAGMSDEEKAHLATLSGGDKMAFMTASSDERKKMMSKSAEGDETITVEGQTVSKRAVGEAQFEIIKRQAAKIVANEAAIAKERTAREDAEYTKRADTDLSHLPGETVMKVKVLRHLDKADADVKETLTKMLEAGDKAITAAYGKLGVKGGDVTKTNGDPKAFEKRIDEVQTANKGMSRTEAMAAARKQYPDEFKTYQGQQ